MRTISSLSIALILSISITAAGAVKDVKSDPSAKLVSSQTDVKSKLTPKATKPNQTLSSAVQASKPISAVISPIDRGRYKKISTNKDTRVPISAPKLGSSLWLNKITKAVKNVEIQRAAGSFSQEVERKTQMLSDYIANSIGCYDSDGGVSAELKGKITFVMQALSTEAVKLSSAEDYCKTDRFLYEHDCSKYVQYPTGPRVLATQITCPDGFKCREGACMEDCKDSDGGLNFTTYGGVETNTVTGRSLKPDTCIDDFQLSESTCTVLNGYAEQRINCCDFGMTCQAGRCTSPAEGQERLCANRNIDLCPEIEGAQIEYPYDNDRDGRRESCLPVNDQVCSEPDPAARYEDATIYEHSGRLHLGFCVPGESSKILHVICGEDGIPQYDTTECAGGLSCLKGMCDSCYDADGGQFDPKIGVTTYIGWQGDIQSRRDQCSWGIKYEYYCRDGQLQADGTFCDPGYHCAELFVEGVPQIGCLPPVLNMSCQDSDGGMNLDQVGFVNGIAPDGTDFMHDDHCYGRAKVEYYCDGEGKIYLEAEELCPEGEYCEEGVENGAPTLRCVPDHPRSCTDTDGTGNFDLYGAVTFSGYDGTTVTHWDSCNTDRNWDEIRSSISDYDCVAPEDCIALGRGMACGFIGCVCLANQRCPDGQVCRVYELDGAAHMGCTTRCVKIGDPESDIFRAGIVYDSADSSYPDFCQDGRVNQYACGADGQVLSIEPQACPNGCDAGACIR